MSSKQVVPSAGRALTPGAIALMLMLCLSWGFNQIAVKLVLPDVPPMLQALIRSAGALPVLLAIGWLRGVKFFERDGTLWPGLIAGMIFGIEFVLIYRGLLLTSASRAVVFLYTAPFFVALGSYRLSRRTAARAAMGRAGPEFCRGRAGDRRPPGQCRCQGLAGRPPDRRRRRAVGGHHADRQGHRADQGAARKRALGYQVALSIPILALAAWISGETITHVPGPLSLSLLAYQAFWVVGLTFLLWFALVKTYSASKLSAFTFITPLFGVVASYFIMHDTLTIAFGVAALLVIAGLYLVNKPDPKVVPDPNVPA